MQDFDPGPKLMSLTNLYNARPKLCYPSDETYKRWSSWACGDVAIAQIYELPMRLNYYLARMTQIAASCRIAPQKAAAFFGIIMNQISNFRNKSVKISPKFVLRVKK